MATLHTSQPRQPWNKAKLIGQKAPLKLKDIWAICVRLQLRDKSVTWHCSTWRWIPNSVPATWSKFGSLMCPMAGRWPLAPW